MAVVSAGVPSLHQETFRSIQPGLSAYADRPQEVRVTAEDRQYPLLVTSGLGRLQVSLLYSPSNAAEPPAHTISSLSVGMGFQSF